MDENNPLASSPMGVIGEELEMDNDGKKKSSTLDGFSKKKPAMEKIAAKKKPFEKSVDKDNGDNFSPEAITEKRARLEKLAADESIDISNVPPRKSLSPQVKSILQAKVAQIASEITLNTIDRINLPPGFPPEPPKAVETEGGSEEEFEAYIREMLIYEDWEKKLLLWHRKDALKKLYNK